MTTADRDRAKTVTQLVVAHAFAGRRGHGGGECTKRVLSPAQLGAYISSAIVAYADDAPTSEG